MTTDTANTRKLGDFELIREVGRGGMGVVYEARQASLGRRVALKVILGIGRQDLAIERFRREAAAAAGLAHPHIVQVYAYGEVDGQHYIAMEFVEGKPLDDVLRERSDGPAKVVVSDSGSAPVLRDENTVQLPRTGVAPPSITPLPTTLVPATRSSTETRTRDELARFVRILIDTARALHSAHERGVLHRDVKPANILLGPDDDVKLADFGLARHQASGDTLTQSGEMMGTLAYMSPEQLSAERIPLSRRTDIYALGVTLYEILVGRRPFDAPSAHLLIQMIQLDEPERPRTLNPAVSCNLETICLKALEKDPERRYATAAEFADDLQRYIDDEPILARPAGPLTRVLKYVKRRKVPITISTILILSAAIIGTLSWTEGKRRREQNHATAQRMLEESLVRAMSAPSAQVIATLDEAIKLDPDIVDLYLERGFLHFNVDDPEAALRDFDQGLARKPGEPALLFAKAAVQGLMDRKAVGAAPPVRLDVFAIDDPIRLTTLGIFEVVNGRSVTALEVFDRAKTLRPEWPQSRFGLGLSYYKLRKYAEAIDALKSYLDFVPKHLVAKTLFTVSKAQQARFAVGLVRDQLLRDARRGLADAKSIAPDDPLLAAVTAVVESVDESDAGRAKFEAALVRIDQLLESSKARGQAISGGIINEILAVLTMERDPARSARYADRALLLRKTSPSARWVQASFRLKEGKAAETADICRSILTGFPDTPEAMAMLLRVHQSNPEIVKDQEADDLCTKLLGILPEDPPMLVTAGEVLAALGRTPQAQSALNEAQRVYQLAGNEAAVQAIAATIKKLAE